jgi:hypothetical protein
VGAALPAATVGVLFSTSSFTWFFFPSALLNSEILLRVNWTRIHLLGKREWIRLRLRLRIGHRTDEVKYSKTEDSNPRK